MDPRPVDRPAAEARRVLVSVSPSAAPSSMKRHTQAIVAELRSGGYDVHATSHPGELEQLAADWQASGDLRCVLACGGDGTAAFVRNHTPLDVPLLAVPLGTENLLGHYLRQSRAAAAVRRTVDQGVAIALDLGRARSESTGCCYFLSMITAGFDAEVVRRLHVRRRGNITRLAYLQPTWEAIRSYQYPELRLYCLDAPVDPSAAISGRWVFGFNLPLYARGWVAAPDADATDGLFDVCVFRRGSVRNVARYLWHVIWRSHLRLADADLFRCRSLRIAAVDGAEVAFQIDGDYGGSLPVEVDVLAGQLRLLVAPPVARRLGFFVHDAE